MKHSPTILAALALTAAARAQTGQWIVQVQYEPGSGGVVSPAHPTATVRILAGFTHAHAFAGGDGDLLAADGQWLSLRLLGVGHPPPPGLTPGTVVGSNVEGFIFSQVSFPPSIANPIPFWEGVWTTSDFSARSWEFRTANTARFSLYDATGKPHAVVPTHGSAAIRIIPAPGTPALFVAAALATTRRRRGRAHKESTP